MKATSKLLCHLNMLFVYFILIIISIVYCNDNKSDFSIFFVTSFVLATFRFFKIVILKLGFDIQVTVVVD